MKKIKIGKSKMHLSFNFLYLVCLFCLSLGPEKRFSTFLYVINSVHPT